MELGRNAAWLGSLTVLPAAEARSLVAEVEDLGYDTIWYPEGLGTRESFTNAAVLLAATSRIRIASGIANIWARDAVATANATRVLLDAFDGRFLLGLGVSHARQVDPRGHVYARPVAAMRAYLAAMDDDPYLSPDGSRAGRSPVPRVLAALRPPMLELARDHALGAHTFLVTPAHTRRAREILGPDRLLVVEQKVLIETDPAVARERARAAIAWYLGTPNYQANLRWLGFEECDLVDGGSNRLVDDLVAWGDAKGVAARLREHEQAGATQVAAQPVATEGDPLGLETLRRLKGELG
jgi:probable F420-dependent oxidoreductase